MGGHGGLNILPQKSWNVYGWKQRQKTARDEEIAAEEEQAVLNAEVQVQRDNRLGELRGRKRGRAEGSAGATISETEHVNFFANEEYALATNRRAAIVERNVDESSRLGGKHASGSTAWYARDERQMSNPLMKGDGFDRRVGVDVKTGANKQGAKRRRKKLSLSALRDERLKREARERQRESEKLSYAQEGRDLMG